MKKKELLFFKRIALTLKLEKNFMRMKRKHQEVPQVIFSPPIPFYTPKFRSKMPQDEFFHPDPYHIYPQKKNPSPELF